MVGTSVPSPFRGMLYKSTGLPSSALQGGWATRSSGHRRHWVRVTKGTFAVPCCTPTSPGATSASTAHLCVIGTECLPRLGIQPAVLAGVVWANFFPMRYSIRRKDRRKRAGRSVVVALRRRMFCSMDQLWLASHPDMAHLCRTTKTANEATICRPIRERKIRFGFVVGGLLCVGI